MSLEKFPALDSNHPLFDWNDHAQSRAALVSGGQCSAFQKETWNAIVDALGDALTAAGLTWDSKYTTFDGAHITEVYGALSAAMFNSVRTNLDMLFGIGWGWAVDPTFRGYVGRKDFNGVASGNPDDVYPEYILELTRGLNLFLEVLRGTADIAEGVHQSNAVTNFKDGVYAPKAARLSVDEIARSLYVGGAIAPNSGAVSFYGGAYSLCEGTARNPRAAVMFPTRYRAVSQYDGTLRNPRAGVLHAYKEIVTTRDASSMMKFRPIYAVSAVGSASSAVSENEATVKAFEAVPFAYQDIAISSEVSEAARCEPQPIRGGDLSKTVHSAVILTPAPRSVAWAEKSMTAPNATLRKPSASRAVVLERSESVHLGILDDWYKRMQTGAKSESKTAVTLSGYALLKHSEMSRTATDVTLDYIRWHLASGSNLKIYQIERHRQANEILYLDRAVDMLFHYADGSNLNIFRVANARQANENLYLDRAVDTLCHFANGDVLNIYRTQYARQKNNDLYLDRAIGDAWDSPEQSGNDLTLKQVYSAVQNGNILEVI